MKKQVVMGMTMVVAVSFSLNAFAAGAKAVETVVRPEIRENMARLLRADGFELKSPEQIKAMTEEQKATYNAQVEAKVKELAKSIKLSEADKAAAKELGIKGDLALAKIIASAASKAPAETLGLVKALQELDIAVGEKNLTEAQLKDVSSTRESLLIMLKHGTKAGVEKTSTKGLTDAQIEQISASVKTLAREVSKFGSEYDSAARQGANKTIKEIGEAMKADPSLSVEDAFFEVTMKSKNFKTAEEAVSFLKEYALCK